MPGPDKILIRRDARFAVSWKPIDGEILLLFLQGDQPDFTIRHGIHCFFPGKDGAAEIPVAALAELLPTTDVDTSNFYFSSVHRDRVAFDDIDIDFLLWNGRQTRVTVE